MTELVDLVGEHILTGVDFFTEKTESWCDDDASVCRFKLDGVIYCAVEDPSDGYRSAMSELVVRSGDRMENVFPPIKVVGKHRTKREYGGDDDILELIDTKTGKVVLEIGTTNTDDYYPSFVANFSPENMAVNAKIEEPKPKPTAQRYRNNPHFGRF